MQIDLNNRNQTARGTISDLLNPTLERLDSTIAEIGYARLVKDFLEDDFSGSDLFGGQAINLIPSPHKGACHPLLMAFSQGMSKRDLLGFANILKRIKTHLIECHPTTNVVAFFCDSWDAKHFQEHGADELAGWHKKDVEFVFLMVTTTAAGTAISEHKVPLK